MTTENDSVIADEERRRYFRVDDAVSLSYHLVPREELSGRLERLEQDLESDFTIMRSLAAISQQMSGIMHKIESSEPDVADYLKAIDQKIDLLGRAFLVQNTDLTDQPAEAVNISASGMAFRVKQPVEIGAVLELKILLLPSFTGILTFAEVVACDQGQEDDDGYSHDLRVNFIHLRDDDQDVLIRHVIRRQSEMLRKRREARELAGPTD